LKAAELLVKCLEQQGVEYIFGVPGEQNIDLLDAIHQSSIQFIVCRHETSAAFIAGVMGKLTGRTGVTLSTLGPGATNMVTGVASATLDRMPLIAITAQIDLPMQKKGSHQYLNLMELYRPITKWSTSIHDGATIPEVISKSFQMATSDLPGAIHIELPNDIAASIVNHGPEVWPPTSTDKKELASDQVIKDVAAAINQAKSPLVFIGRNAVSREVASAILPFVETLQAPFTETFMAKGVVSGHHPLHLQTIGLPDGDFVNDAFQHADLVITIGYDTIEYGAKKWNTANVPIIHIDETAPENNNDYPVKASLIGDISVNLQRLMQEIQQREIIDPYYQNLKEMIVSDAIVNVIGDTYPVAPQRIIKEIQALLNKNDAILLSDVGAHKLWIGRLYDVSEPNTCIISNGLASMGIALPGAIGAKIAFPNKKVLAVCGDGGFMMSMAELETAVRLQLSIVIMVWTDNRYAMIEWEQQNKLGRTTSVQFNNPDFVTLAESHGAKGIKVEKASEIGVILQRAFLEKGPVIVECPVDYTENFRLTERLNTFKG
jgi:acetolactate synthase I/II/III large subunit